MFESEEMDVDSTGGNDSDNDTSMSELHRACKEGNVDKVKALIEEKKADPIALKTCLDEQDDNGNTPLHLTCKRYPIFGEATKISSPLLIIEPLVENGAWINAENNEGETPLYLACQRLGDNAFVYDYDTLFSVVKFLIANGADVDKKNKKGQTPLHITCKVFGCLEIVEFLVNEHSADVTLEDNKGKSALYYTLSKSADDTDPLDFLIKKGADINAKLKTGKPLLHCAFEADINYLQLLLDRKADIDIQDKKKNTLLHLLPATKKGIDVMRMLLSKGANPNIVNDKGKTPLDVALKKGYTYNINIDLLLNYGAKRAKDLSEHNPVTTETEEVLLDLLETDFIPQKIENELIADFIFSQHVEKMQEKTLNPEQINEQDPDGNTKLHVACKKAYVEEVTQLLDKNADPDIKNTSGQTALHIASRTDHVKIIEMLCKHSKNESGINLQDNNGTTPLHEACGISAYDRNTPFAMGSYEGAKWLLEHGADPNIPNNQGQTPIHAGFGHPYNAVDLAPLLLLHGGKYALKDNRNNKPTDLVEKKNDKQQIEKIITFIELR